MTKEIYHIFKSNQPDGEADIKELDKKIRASFHNPFLCVENDGSGQCQVIAYDINNTAVILDSRYVCVNNEGIEVKIIGRTKDIPKTKIQLEKSTGYVITG